MNHTTLKLRMTRKLQFLTMTMLLSLFVGQYTQASNHNILDYPGLSHDDQLDLVIANDLSAGQISNPSYSEVDLYFDNQVKIQDIEGQVVSIEAQIANINNQSTEAKTLRREMLQLILMQDAIKKLNEKISQRNNISHIS